MKRLVVMRHAKAGFKGSEDDHARQLTDRGRRDAGAAAAALLRSGWIPEHALVSDAERTWFTWMLVEQGLGRAVPAEVQRRLYLPGVGDLLAAIRELPPEVTTAVVVSHNPGCELLVQHLTGGPVAMRTSALVLLEVQGPWWDVGRVSGGATCVGHETPRAG